MKQKLRQFFTDSEGHIVIGQWPNAALIIWIGASLLNRLVSDEALSNGLTFLAFSAGGYWAALEILRGDSPFRRVVGVSILGALIYSIVRRQI